MFMAFALVIGLLVHFLKKIFWNVGKALFKRCGQKAKGHQLLNDMLMVGKSSLSTNAWENSTTILLKWCFQQVFDKMGRKNLVVSHLLKADQIQIQIM